jgi:hypothetical protein
VVRGPDELVYGSAREKFAIHYADEWYPVERNNNDYWSWAGGNGVIEVTNPQAVSLVVRLRFALTVATPRTVWLQLNGSQLWSTELDDHSSLQVTLNELVLPPGKSKLVFVTDQPPSKLGSDPRPLAFRLQNLRVDVQRPAPKAN